jgi:predicted nucleic acid-binding protein
VVDGVFPVDLPAVERAKAILADRRRLSARDALHLAIMERNGVEEILTFDAGFDGFPGITRIGA